MHYPHHVHLSLQILNGDGGKMFVHGHGDQEHGLYQLEVRLPEGITCSHCVIQWHYRTGRWLAGRLAGRQAGR